MVSPSLADSTLDEVIRLGETEEDRRKAYASMGIRAALLGMFVAIREVRKRRGVSRSAVTRFGTKHGLRILQKDPRWRAPGHK